MTRGRYDRKRENRRLRRELRWWNEDCPASFEGHRAAPYSDTTATCGECGALIERAVTVHPPNDSRLRERVTFSPWRTRPFIIEELP